MNNSTKSNTIKISEKLEISETEVLLPEVPDDIIYPNELNTYLSEQLRYYVHKIGMVEKNLKELEESYSACKENVSKLENKLSGYENLCDKSKINTSSQIISSKIIELSKKLREKTSEVESLKTKYSKLEKQAFELRNQLENDSQKFVKYEVTTPQNSLTDEEIKKYNDKVSHLTNKIAEVKNVNIQLKKELKLAKKLLQQEVGDDFENLQAVYNANYAGWRGRSQIICDLQQKNSDLKEKLKQTHEKCTMVEVPHGPSKIETQLNVFIKENNELKIRIEDFKKKYEAAKARVKVLDMEYGMAKSKLSMLKDQATRDQEIISTLSKQMNSSREAKNEALAQKEHEFAKLQTEKNQLLQEMEEYKSVISDLREKINTYNKPNNDKQETLPNVPERTPSKQTANKVTETDNQYQGVLEVIENINRRLKTEREDHARTQSSLRVEKQKSTKAEAAIAKMELEYNSLKSGYSSSSQLRLLEPNLKDQLELAEESLKAAKTRLEIEQLERKADVQTFAQILKIYDIQIPQNI